MRRAWSYLAIAVGLVAVGWLAQVHTLAFEWMAREDVTKLPEDWEVANHYALPIDQQPLGDEGDMADLTYTSTITLENLWDPFLVSGPVLEIRWAAAGFCADIEILDVTNNLGACPPWWDATICGVGTDGQIWRVQIIEPLGIVGFGWFYVCDPTSGYTLNVTAEFFNVTKIACQYHYDATSYVKVTVGPIWDAAGNPGNITVSARPSFWNGPGILSRHIWWEGCLHKGSEDTNYITQAFTCDDYTIDIDAWHEPFCGTHYLGYAASARVAKWKCLVKTPGCDACADGTWLLGPVPRRLAMDRDPMDVEWVVWVDGSDIKVIFRETDLTTWSAPVVVDNSGEYDQVDISHPGGVVFVVARRSCDHELCEWYSHDRGANWDGPHVIT